MLVRRTVLEGYTPDITGIARLLEGKARDFRVRTTDLLSEEQSLIAFFTRIIESDFLPHDKREEILNRLIPAIVQAEKEPTALEEVANQETSERRLRRRTAAVGLMGLLAATVGSVVTALPSLLNLDTQYPKLFEAVLVTGTISLALITVLILFFIDCESRSKK